MFFGSLRFIGLCLVVLGVLLLMAQWKVFFIALAWAIITACLVINYLMACGRPETKAKIKAFFFKIRRNYFIKKHRIGKKVGRRKNK
ncbi:MAG: hypothetical protein FWD15_02105 [Alphaproteobacteria bacterium]|nr:hypothetical protein [Alphaproteobacteria bacterium]